MLTIQDTGTFSRQVQNMFGAVAPRYDFLNRFLSAGQDKYWRKIAVDRLGPKGNEKILDLAAGTADVALEIATRADYCGKVVGLDFSSPMLELGKKKVHKEKKHSNIILQTGCGINLPYAGESFNGVICAFGIRNFSDPYRGLLEAYRVLKIKGKIVILEFSYPSNAVLSMIYRLYFNHILPRIGQLVSGDQNAYRYLPNSVSKFPMRSEFAGLLENAGFSDVTYEDFTQGIVTLYEGKKHV